MIYCRFLKMGSTELCGKAALIHQEALPKHLRGYCRNHKLRIARGGGTIPCEKCGRGCKTILHNICYRCSGRVVSNKILEDRRSENSIGCRYLSRGSTEYCGKAIYRNQDSLPEKLRGYCAYHKYRVIHKATASSAKLPEVPPPVLEKNKKKKFKKKNKNKNKKKKNTQVERM